MISAAHASTAPAWVAELSLEFAAGATRTELASARHSGPLRVQRLLHPSDAPAECLILHPPGGVAGGDRLSIDVCVAAAAEVLISTPGAGKWYRSAGRTAEQHLSLRVANGGALEWLPQESLLFREADALQTLQIHLENDARHIGWDIVQLGRIAAGERWDAGRFRQSLSLHREGKLVWHEYADLLADDPTLDAPTCLAGARVFGTLWAAAPSLTSDAMSALEAVRTALPQTHHSGRLPAPAETVESDLCVAATWLAAPANLLLARALGNDCEHVRQSLELAWATLRPWVTGNAARRPRIWAT